MKIEEKEITLNPDEALDYIRNNVEIYDTLDLSYNRIYAPGEVLGLDFEDEDGNEIFKVTIHLSGELVSDTVEIDMLRLKDQILELRHENDKGSTLIFVEED